MLNGRGGMGDLKWFGQRGASWEKFVVPTSRRCADVEGICRHTRMRSRWVKRLISLWAGKEAITCLSATPGRTRQVCEDSKW